jgi:hypothetical protein
MAQQPQTSAFALLDSPVGLLAWNAQFLGEDLDTDFALTNVMLYWLTGTGASAARLYYENAHAAPQQNQPLSRSGWPPSAVSSAASDASPNASTLTSFTGQRSITAATLPPQGARLPRRRLTELLPDPPVRQSAA